MLLCFVKNILAIKNIKNIKGVRKMKQRKIKKLVALFLVIMLSLPQEAWGELTRLYDCTPIGSVGGSNSGYAYGIYSFAFGMQAITGIKAADGSLSGGDYAVAMGNRVTASGKYSIAMGSHSTASGNYSVAMGGYSTASGLGSFAGGGYYSGSTAKDGGIAYGNGSFAFGTGAVAGSSANAGGTAGTIAMGSGAQATAANSAALANGATASGTNSIALGCEAKATHKNSVALGNGSVTTEDNTVSVGNSITQKRITCVAAGTADTDAVNYGQVKSAYKAVTSSKSGTTTTYTLTAIGGATATIVDTDTQYSAGNGLLLTGQAFSIKANSLSAITVDTNGVGLKLTSDFTQNSTNGLQLVKDGAILATGGKSGNVVTGATVYSYLTNNYYDKTTADSTFAKLSGATFTGAISGTTASFTTASFSGGLSAGGKITGVIAGEAATDAVNYSQIITSVIYDGTNLSFKNCNNEEITSVAIGGGGGGGGGADPLAVHYKDSYKTAVELKTGGTTISNVKAVTPTEGGTNAATTGQLYEISQAKADKATTLEGYGITDAYTKDKVYTKTETDSALALKANASDVYTKAEVYTKTEMDTALDAKANATDVYTKTVADGKFADKAETNSALDTKANLAGATFTGAVTTTKTGTGQGDFEANEFVTKTWVEHNMTTTGGTVVKANFEGAMTYDTSKNEYVADGKIAAENEVVASNASNDMATNANGDVNHAVSGKAVYDYVQPIANQIENNTASIADLSNRVDKVETRTSQVGAHAAALSALHPLPYDPNAPTSFSAGVGTYRDETSYAIGVFHYTSDRFMFNLGASVTKGADVMGRAGISFSLGKGSSKKAKKANLEQEQIQLAMANMEQNFNNQLASQKVSYENRIQKYEDRTQKLEAELAAMKKLIASKLNLKTNKAKTQKSGKRRKKK